MGTKRSVSNPSSDSGKTNWPGLLGLAAALAGILGSVVAVAAWLFPRPAPPPPSPPDIVAECHEKHPEALGKPVQTGAGALSTYIIEGCRAPGIPGVGDNGHWKAELSIYAIPNTALVDPVTEAQVFLTDCPALGLDYRYATAGSPGFNPMVVRVGQTVSGLDGASRSVFSEGVPEEVVSLSASIDRLIVLNNGRNELQTVSCEDVDAVAPKPATPRG